MARFKLEPGPIPLHHQVLRDLSAALDGHEWEPGDRMPTERDLAERYGCSLITVRHALGELVREGRIERTRGRGTFVAQPRIDRDIAGSMSFEEEMKRRGLDPATRLVTGRIEPAGNAVGGLAGPRRGCAGRLSRARQARRWRAAHPRAGASAGRALPRAARLRFRASVALRHPGRALRDAYCPCQGIGRAGEPAGPGSEAARQVAALLGASDRWRGLRGR